MRAIAAGWTLARTAADLHSTPPAHDAVQWQTLAGAVPVAAARPGIDNDELDQHDWWYRVRFDTADADQLVLESVATIADVYLDGALVGHSESMFRPLEVTLPAGAGERELAVCCRALAPRLAERRRPRARWRTKLVTDGNLRFHRTMLLGRAPGFAPGPAAVGLCAPVRLTQRRPGDRLGVHTRLDGADGVLTTTGAEVLNGTEIHLSGPTGQHRGAVGEPLRIPDVARWWPHTHGAPNLYDVSIDGAPSRAVGFRDLSWPADWEDRGFGLAVNGIDVFCRGAVWTPVDRTVLQADPAALTRRLRQVVAAGMNMLRIPGTGTYESDTFHDLCDRLGILVWQDMMFANLDYPDTDPEFVAEVRAEAAFQLGRLAGRPSLAVVCGGSECAQQVTMLGLDPDLARGPLYTEIVPDALTASGADAAYIPNSPWGGELPFRPDAGVSNYYGVGAYLRDVSEARTLPVGFTGECLAFSNVGERAELTKQGIPRDRGTGWDFEDVRDHYFHRLYGLDPVRVRWAEPDRYLELSSVVTGEVMAETMGMWRCPDSPTRGALVLWLADLEAGSGWGLLDERGIPKAAYWRLAQALAPQAVWLTDRGLSGIDVHAANDGDTPLAATLRVSLYRDGEIETATAVRDVTIPAHGYLRHGVEEVLDRFVDVSWAYRFGPPNQDVVVASLEGEAGLISQAFAFPVGRPLERQTPASLGLYAALEEPGDGRAQLRVGARHVVHGLRIRADGWVPSVDCLSLAPGYERTVQLNCISENADLRPRISALNCVGGVSVSRADQSGADPLSRRGHTGNRG